MPINKKHAIRVFPLRDDGVFPNSRLPVLFYQNVFKLPFFFPALMVEKKLKENSWSNFQKSGVLEYHHYHSITHEVMAVISGTTTLLLGGDKGVQIEIKKGDVLIIPAGVAHKNLAGQNDITCILAYPDGKDYDMKYGEAGERPFTDEKIKKVGLPLYDPVFGSSGPLHENWKPA